VLLKTTNGGVAWTAQSGGTSDTLRGISFPLDSVTGWIVGNGGVIRETSNGGMSWLPVSSGTTEILRDVQFPTDQVTGYAVGDLGIILKHIVD
jgi:photosystem II stability/assembly factor-like uncharacterized protein